MKEIIIEEKLLGGVYAQEVRGELIRCKDCKYWRPNTEFCGRWTFGFIAHRTPANWYCADGEVKQDG